MENLTKENVLLLAAKKYTGPTLVLTEFMTDYGRTKSIKKLLGKYKSRGELAERLILNHMIVLANCFGVEFASKMLFFSLDEEYHSALVTFLLYLGYVDKKVVGVNGKDIMISDIPLDMEIAKVLREIKVPN